MVARDALVAYINELLQVQQFQDYCPNGLQVEGSAEVRHIVSGVTASRALVEAALDCRADTLLVHHGYFWKGEDARVVGMKKRRLQALLAHDINLLAYHLPLDAHPEFGNNAQLAQQLGLTIDGWFGSGAGPALGCYGRLVEPMSPASLSRQLEQALGRPPLHLAGGGASIARIGWCTGAAQSYIEAAAGMGLDAFISGEVSEQTTHQALELSIHYFGAGHHATERYGVQALGAHLATRFGLQHQFVDIDNPV